MEWRRVRVKGATLPSPRFEQSMVSVGVYLFLFGGGNMQGYLNDLMVFDTGI